MRLCTFLLTLFYLDIILSLSKTKNEVAIFSEREGRQGQPGLLPEQLSRSGNKRSATTLDDASIPNTKKASYDVVRADSDDSEDENKLVIDESAELPGKTPAISEVKVKKTKRVPQYRHFCKIIGTADYPWNDNFDKIVAVIENLHTLACTLAFGRPDHLGTVKVSRSLSVYIKVIYFILNHPGFDLSKKSCFKDLRTVVNQVMEKNQPRSESRLLRERMKALVNLCYPGNEFTEKRMLIHGDCRQQCITNNYDDMVEGKWVNSTSSSCYNVYHGDRDMIELHYTDEKSGSLVRAYHRRDEALPTFYKSSTASNKVVDKLQCQLNDGFGQQF